MLSFPKVVLKVPSDKFLSNPIATSTCDGSGFPVLQAEPAEAHIPFSSNSSSNFCAFIFGNEKFAFPGSLLFLSPFNFAVGIFCSI